MFRAMGKSPNVPVTSDSIWQDIRLGDWIALPYGYPPGLVLAVYAEEGPVDALVAGRLVRFSKTVLADEPVLYRPSPDKAERLVQEGRLAFEVEQRLRDGESEDE